MSVDATHADEKLERCVSDLREAMQLIEHALDALAAAEKGTRPTAPPAPRVRRAMPSIGPRRPATRVVDDW